MLTSISVAKSRELESYHLYMCRAINFIFYTQLLFEINSPNIMIKTVINNEEGISQMSKCKKIERFKKES